MTALFIGVLATFVINDIIEMMAVSLKRGMYKVIQASSMREKA